ncbi:MAG: glycosyltransferase family 2 protein [Desulfobulbaceae bacterium]|nr:glycosyltransferase family 2 protein [Desulfobulbaceae bacterium]
MPDKESSLSVIIPTLNGAQWLKSILPILEQQTRAPDEILVVDSQSTDETLDLARSHNARVITVQREKFDHGGTRTMAASLAVGDILVYMTQDAVPADSRALENLIAPFADKRVAAAYGRQIPSPGATFSARHLRVFNYPAESSVKCWEDRKKFGFKTAFISNSFAAYRKNLLAEAGFFPDGLLFGEDTLAAARLLQNGYCVAYVAEARVQHSHSYSVLQEFRRYFDIGVFHSLHQELLTCFGTLNGEGRRYIISEFRQLAGDKDYLRLPESALRSSMKFLAYNLGKRYSCLPRRVAVFCSMNRGWWFK